jgi:hypothetical protein
MRNAERNPGGFLWPEIRVQVCCKKQVKAKSFSMNAHFNR